MQDTSREDKVIHLSWTPYVFGDDKSKVEYSIDDHDLGTGFGSVLHALSSYMRVTLIIVEDSIPIASWNPFNKEYVGGLNYTNIPFDAKLDDLYELAEANDIEIVWQKEGAEKSQATKSPPK